MRTLKQLDFFTGIAGFHVAATRNGRIETLCTSEIDPFNAKLIDRNLNLENAGDICNIAISRNAHPYSDGEDVVYVEKTGFTSLCIDDFMEGIIDFPDICTGGFPCQNISSANLNDASGIDGEQSSLVKEQLRIIEALEIPICIFENAEGLVRKGLDRILVALNDMGYIVEWETISATAFNYPHYRHRVYIVAYLPHTNLAKTGTSAFETTRWTAQYHLDKPFKLPLLHEDPNYIKQHAVAVDTRAIKLRTKRINGLGNAVIPDIPESIYSTITRTELDNTSQEYSIKADEERPEASLTIHSEHVIDAKGNRVTTMPSRGVMKSGTIYSDDTRCSLLNPTKTAYAGLFSTLIRKDGNNNFTTSSRLNRPGKLGGLVGEIMSIGVRQGGLHPEFCERFMGYDVGYTELQPITKKDEAA